MSEFSIITKVGGYGRPVFLFDVDGVISKWFSRIVAFLKHKGLPFEHVEEKMQMTNFISPKEIFSTSCEKHASSLLAEYNESHFIAELDPISSDTKRVLNTIAEFGDLMTVTCIGESEITQKHRINNIEAICGRKIFSEHHFLRVGQSKEDVIRKIMNRRNVVFYADDSAKHVREGLKAGANSFQFTLGVSDDNLDPDLNHIMNWSEVLEVALEFKPKQKEITKEYS
ncbi:hypothetical protein QTV49_001674 [Vibrio vulnificus]|nr:hypothetical protein [Vibrio vulnificus]